MQRKTAAAGRAAAARVLAKGDWSQHYLALAGACRRAAECTLETCAAVVLKLQATFVLRSLPQVIVIAIAIAITIAIAIAIAIVIAIAIAIVIAIVIVPQVLLDAANGGAFAASMRPDRPFSAFWQDALFGDAAESVTLYCRVPRAWRVDLGGVDPGCP